MYEIIIGPAAATTIFTELAFCAFAGELILGKLTIVCEVIRVLPDGFQALIS